MTIQEQKPVAIISGALGYVGSEIARTLAASGMRIAALTKNAQADDISHFLGSLSGEGHAVYTCSLEDAAAVEKAFADIAAGQGDIIVAVHAAWGKLERKQLLNSTDEDFASQSTANITNSFHFLSAAARLFKKQKNGVIIGITTIGVVQPEATGNLGAYIPAKYALQGMLAALRSELASSGVRVYSVAPDFMEGGLNADIPKAFVEIMKQKNNGVPFITPQDVAKSVAELCVNTAGQDMFTVVVSHMNKS